MIPPSILVSIGSMATIKARKKANGEVRYTAVVRIRDCQKIVHTESQTFSYRSAANAWAKRREVALEDPAELSRVQEQKQRAQLNLQTYQLKSLIRWYIDTFRQIGNWQRTKQTTLEFLERHPIGGKDARHLTSSDLVNHIQDRRGQGAGPSTAGNDLTWIGVVLRAAKGVKQVPVNPAIVGEARAACRELRLIAKSRRRDRRPTQEEIRLLDEYFDRSDRRSNIPMRDIWHFAMESTKREAEICRIKWADNDPKGRTGMVRDAKHPRAKEGKHRRFKYTAEAWEIVQRQPRSNARIFPYNSKTISTLFTRACKVLGIRELRFHDARHEGTSKLFERGYQIHEVTQFTCHDSWNELKRYTNLRPENLRDIPSTSPPVPPARRAHLPSNVIPLPVRADGQSIPRDPRR